MNCKWFATPERARTFADDPDVLADHNTIGIRANINRAPPVYCRHTEPSRHHDGERKQWHVMSVHRASATTVRSFFIGGAGGDVTAFISATLTSPG
jgi:hypothetical protein